jgi:hypothetical protein
MLTPVTDGYRPHYANSLVWFESVEVRIVMNFNNQAGDFFEFFAAIENKCDTAVAFEPLDVYAEIYTDEDSLAAEPEILYSVDPGEQLELIKKDIADLNRQKRMNEGLSCFFFAVSTAISIASNQPPDDSIFDDTAEAEDEYSYNASVLNQEKSFWENEVLRGSLILPGKKTAGSFFIPISPGAEWVKVIIPFGDSEYIFNFRQTKA